MHRYIILIILLIITAGCTKQNLQCEQDSDCQLVVYDGSCRYCPYCETFSLEDQRVIAVPTNWDPGCPEKPDNINCISCVDNYNFDPTNDVKCVSGECVKNSFTKQ
ncbi:MAG: hypothetical protein AABW49_00220 [Nanoarchaeota archaeon]